MARSTIDQFFRVKEKHNFSKSKTNNGRSSGGFAEDLYSQHIQRNNSHAIALQSQYQPNHVQSARQNQTFVVQVTPVEAQHVNFNFASYKASFGSKIDREGAEGAEVVGVNSVANSALAHGRHLQLHLKSTPTLNSKLDVGSNVDSSFILNTKPSIHSTDQASTCFANTNTNPTNGTKTSRKVATNIGDFELFPKLPLELRFRVWKFAALQPRIIEIRDLEGKLGFSGSAARCPLLLVSREARRECLRVKSDVNSTFTFTPTPNSNPPLPKPSTDSKSASAVPSIINERSDTGKPKVHANLAVDTLYLTFSRTDIYNTTTLPPLWQNITNHLTLHVRTLAISYSLFKRRWDDMNAMIFKLDLEELVLVVDAEDFAGESGFVVPVFVKARSEVGRRSAVWRDWEGVRRSEVRQLKDCRAHVRYAFKRALMSETREQLLQRGKRDLADWKMPKISIRDLVDLKNATKEGLRAVAAEKTEYGAEENDGDESGSEEDEEYEYA